MLKLIAMLSCIIICLWISAILPSDAFKNDSGEQMIFKNSAGSSENIFKSSSSSQACAACKYQRRKCTKNCQLARYFPADQPEKFQHAHRLYGVRNILSILKKVPDQDKSDAMMSIIYESNMRKKFPVHGCVDVISRLQYQVDEITKELQAVRARLCIEKAKEPLINSNDNVIVDEQSFLPLVPDGFNYEVQNPNGTYEMDLVSQPFYSDLQEFLPQQDSEVWHQTDNVQNDSDAENLGESSASFNSQPDIMHYILEPVDHKNVDSDT